VKSHIVFCLCLFAFLVLALSFFASTEAANVGGGVSPIFSQLRLFPQSSTAGTNVIVKPSEATGYALPMEPGLYFSGGAGRWPTVQVMDGVAALSATGVHAAITIPTGTAVYTTVTTGITSPATYRVLSITGSAAAALSAVVVTGTDWAGNTITETITGTGAAKVIGNRPFKTVTAIVVWGVAVPGGATYTIGWDDKLGLYRPIETANTGTALDGDVTQIMTKATAETAWVVTAAAVLPTGAAVDAIYDTVLPETTITAVDGYMICYNASGW
jgi:hypothetical protein